MPYKTCSQCGGNGWIFNMRCAQCRGQGAIRFPDAPTNDPRQPDLTGYAPGSFGCHEVFHALDMLRRLVHHEVISHPAVETNPDWLTEARAIREKMFALRKSIGAKHIKEEVPRW